MGHSELVSIQVEINDKDGNLITIDHVVRHEGKYYDISRDAQENQESNLDKWGIGEIIDAALNYAIVIEEPSEGSAYDTPKGAYRIALEDAIKAARNRKIEKIINPQNQEIAKQQEDDERY